MTWHFLNGHGLVSVVWVSVVCVGAGQGEVGEAISVARAASEESPLQACSVQLLGRALVATGDVGSAYDTLSAFHKRVPADRGVARQLGAWEAGSAVWRSRRGVHVVTAMPSRFSSLVVVGLGVTLPVHEGVPCLT